MIKPTVGRSLHFFAGSDSDRKTFRGPGPFACILAGVVSDECINVGVFTNEGAVVPRTHVALVQESEMTSEGQSFCAWMPFQQGQATRTDNVEGGLMKLLASVNARMISLEEQVRTLTLAAGNPFDNARANQLNQAPTGTAEQLESAFAAHQAKISEARRDYEEKRDDGVGVPVGLTGTPGFQEAQAESTAQLRSIVEEQPLHTFESTRATDDLDFADEDDSDLEDDE